MPGAAKALRNAAPQLLGFGVGLAAFSYVEKYGYQPPEVVASNEALFKAHMALLSARIWFKNLGRHFGTDSTATNSDAPNIDPFPLLGNAKEAYDAKDLTRCAESLREAFLTSAITHQYIDMMMYSEELNLDENQEDKPFSGNIVSALNWASEVVPELWKKKELSDSEALVVTLKLSRVDPTSLTKNHEDLMVDLPMKVLRDESFSETTAVAGTLLALSSVVHAAEMNQLRGGSQSWLSSLFSSTNQTNKVAELIASDQALVAKVVSLLPLSAEGVQFPSILLRQIIESNSAHIKTIVQHNAIRETASELIRGYSSFDASGASTMKEPHGSVHVRGDLVELLSTLVEAGHPNGTKRTLVGAGLAELEATEVIPLADAVFRALSEQVADEPHLVKSGLHLLKCMLGDVQGCPVAAPISRSWLVEKGIVVAAARSLNYYGRGVLEEVTHFLDPILTDPEMLKTVPEEHLAMLGEVC